jgi:plasmid stability protein
MATRTLTLEVPDPLYERLMARAARTQRSVEAETLEALTSAVPEENDLIDEISAQLSVLDDEALWRAARVHFSQDMAHELEELHFKRQHEGLTETEAQRARILLHHYDRAMLVRAEAAALLKARGHDVSPLLQPR